MALVVPLLLVDVPPLLDYPNHLARMVVLAANGSDPVLARFYVPHWGIIPDLGIDLVTPPLLHIFPVHVAGRIVIALALLLPVIGTVAYSVAVTGRRTYWSLCCVLVAYNGALLQGFLNFSASVGLALLLAAAWLRWREAFPLRTLLLAIPGAVALFFCHLMGLLFFALLIGVHEITILLPLAGQPALLLRRSAMRLAYSGVVLLGPVVLYGFSDLPGTAAEPEYLSAIAKAAQLLFPLVNYALPLDVATAVLVVVGLTACFVTRQLWIPPRAALSMALVALLYLAAPFGFKGTANLDSRFLILLGFLLFAGVAPLIASPRERRLVGLGVIALFALRMAVLATAWAGHNADLTELRQVTQSVAPGSTVFLTSVGPDEAPSYWDHTLLARRLSDGLRTDTHMAALLLIERRAWWPLLFDNDSQQPIRTRQPYRSLANRVGGMPPHNALLTPDKVNLCGFDHVLLLEAGAEPNLATFARDRLRLVASSDAAALFDVRKDPICPPLLHPG